jgi:alpha-tubulin suppressor-like RCC1 family protein
MVRCWGAGFNGQLGYNSTGNIADGFGPSIINVGDVPLTGIAVQITAGGSHTCALLDAGGVKCWGANFNGQLGFNNTGNVGDGFGPSIDAAGGVPVGSASKGISAGSNTTCARLTTGTVRCWGEGFNGALGYNSTANVGDGFGPTILGAGDVPVGGPVARISAGEKHTCAVLKSGGVRCWGNGKDGRLGYGNTGFVADGFGPSILTAGDVSLGGPAIQVRVGGSHSCALLANYEVRCWGYGWYGALGYGNPQSVGDNELPGSVGPVPILEPPPSP